MRPSPAAGRRAAAGLVTATALLCGADGAALPWLSVKNVGDASTPHAFVLVDEVGREVVLRGVNVELEERSLPGPGQRPVDPAAYEGRCPENMGGYSEPPVCELQAGAGKYKLDVSEGSRNDLAQLRALGMNYIRLCLSWSELEPVPGVYNSTYLDRVEQIVGWAREQDVRVLLDMHQDLYSVSIQSAGTAGIPPYLVPTDGQDGAPAWATLTDGWPPLAVEGIGERRWGSADRGFGGGRQRGAATLSEQYAQTNLQLHRRAPGTLPPAANLNLAVLKAFDNFWLNTVPPGVPQGDAPGVRRGRTMGMNAQW
jgi:hypothetical protein